MIRLGLSIIALVLFGSGCVVSKPIDRTPVAEPSAYRETVFGYISSITSSSNGQESVTVQPSLWLTGIEAQMMAKEDGACDTPEYCLPNDYYIHRFDQTVAYPVAASVLIQTYSNPSGMMNSNDNGVFLAPLTFAAFKQAHAAEASVFKHVPFHVELEQGEIVTITEQYVP